MPSTQTVKSGAPSPHCFLLPVMANVMRLPTERKPRTSSRTGGGSSHARYDHQQRPTKIEVVCPNCSGRAIATEPNYDQGTLTVGDLSPSWETPAFSIRCTNCLLRLANQHYTELPAPYHQIAIAGRTLWAWNQEHLEMLLHLLEGKSIQGHPYAFFATYIHRGWQQWRKKFAHAIRQHLATHNTTTHRTCAKSRAVLVTSTLGTGNE